MPLDEYRRKRDPAKTPEPVPAADQSPSPTAGSIFVIQQHHARSLHWDLRLERDGVLVSWAVPKGLPPDPDTIRLAVHTEDHPMEYADFAGEIPRGEYGAGRMTIWDRGSYETLKWSDSEVQVVLHGERAQGRYILLRRGRGPNDWLLRRGDPPPSRDWSPLPRGLSPMLATPGGLPSPDEGWSYEVRFGGTRVLVRVEGGRVELFDPEGAPLRTRHSELAGLGTELGSTAVLLDAEIDGSPSGLWINDLLHVDGRDVTGLPYLQRRALAESLPLTGPAWRLTPSYTEGGAAVLAAATEQRLPAVVAKRDDSPYLPGQRDDTWVEVRAGAEPSKHRASGRAVSSVEVAGRKVRLSNPDKVIYPATGFRKRDVLDYYLAVAPVMLPHLADRPVTLRRWPDGVAAASFFEKNVSRHAPDWVRTVRLDTPGSAAGSEYLDYPLLDDEATLAWVANLAALELHVPQWTVGTRGGRHNPDLLVFDLDPGEGTTIVECARVAERIAELLAQDELPAYPRTSGGKGMQLYTPVRVSAPERTGEYAKGIAERLATSDPAHIVATMARQRRRGKVFIDWSQNNPVKTTVASYSLRGRERPTVATPLTWAEVRECTEAEQLVFTATDLAERIRVHGDLLEPLLGPGHRLPARR
ncbi:non-homologous end-joining DNA ligase [Pseudonocardia sp.]|jgi:bifunctional non-homologous end joining protein LigD|uniref:non-homologous end-joining DNA ligase n=1 Tax=Pseudonocardia sp. TaxID=60912 RepID=UPI0039C9FAE6